MLAIDCSVFKMQLPVELDPDFGNSKQDNGHGFVVSVFKKSKENSKEKKFKYQFILLVPNADIPDDDLEVLFSGIADNFFEKNEEYRIRDLTDEDVEKYTKDTSILSFHPESIHDERVGFFWQKPPRHLTH